MTDDLQRGGCPICHEPFEGVARLAQLSTTTQLEQFTTTPPGSLPDNTVSVEWLALPCWHMLPSQIEVWDAAVDLWGEDVAKAINGPLPRRVAA
jgi:hypothetical protein